jgi:hypothetical protein
VLYILIFCGLFSCSTTKSLKDGDVLYTGSKLFIKKKKTDRSFEINELGRKTADTYLSVWDLPNGSILGTPFFRFIPFRLHIYNLFYTSKEKGVKYWIRNNFGEEPVLIDDVQPDLKVKKLEESYESYGHFGSTASYTLKYKRHKKKAFISYILEVTEAFTYRDISFETIDGKDSLNKYIEKYKLRSLLQPNEEFNLDTIQTEKTNLLNALRNNGFYYLEASDIIMEADTNVGYKKADIRIRINDELSDYELSPVTVNDFDILIDSVNVTKEQARYYHYTAGRIKKNFTDSIIKVKVGRNFSQKKVNQSTDILNNIGIFSNLYFSYIVDPNDSSKLKTVLNLLPAKATSISFNANGNFKTAGYLGPSIGIKTSQLNAFGKAENFTSEIDAYYDFPMGIYRDRISNSSGISIKNTIRAPFLNSKIRFPTTSNSIPFHFASVNLEYNNRINFFKIISLNALYGMDWKSSKYIRHRIDWVNTTYSSIVDATPRFDELIVKDPFLRNSLIDQFIFGSSYTFTLDKRKKTENLEGLYFQGQIELAGNIIMLASSALKNNPLGSQKIFNVPFAQFALLNYDVRYYKKIGKLGTLAFRHLGGFGTPYGNSSRMPYIRQFFIGGTNSLRPLNARSVGPGRYLEFEKGEVNQVGDIKLEVNIEYRIRLGSRLNAAIWSDMGNIWLLNEDSNRPNSGIRWNKIIQDSYLTAGVGLRLDLKFIVLRYDYGALLYAPIFTEGNKWIWQNKLPLWGSVIGFGYPF